MSPPLMPPGRYPSPNELGALIGRTHRSVERAAEAWLAPLGLPVPVVRLLRLLTREPGQSAAQLARRTGLAPQSVALAIERARAAGLVERVPHPVHGRVMRVYPTQAGYDAFRRASQVTTRLERELAADLDDRARALIWRQLRRIAEHAEAAAGAPPGPPGGRKKPATA